MSFLDMLQSVAGVPRRRTPLAYPGAPGTDQVNAYDETGGDEDIFDPRGPAAAGQEPTVEATPQHQGAASPFDPTPYQERIRQTSGALQSKLDELGHLAYTPPQHGKGYRLAEGLVGMFSPQLSNALFERTEQRNLEGYHQNLDTQGRQVSALQNAAQDAIREMGTAQTGDFYKRRGSYYDQLTQASQDKVETLKSQYEQAVQKAITEHRDPHTDPMVSQLKQAIQDEMRPPAEPGETPYRDWRKMHPNADPIEWQRAQAQVKDDFRRDPAPKQATKGQSINIERRKQGALAAAEARFKLGSIDQQELEETKQRIQDAYEAEIQAGGGEAEHFAYPGPGGEEPTEPAVAAPAAPGASAPAAQPRAKLTLDEAKAYLQKAGGDKNKARQLATQDGRSF